MKRASFSAVAAFVLMAVGVSGFVGCSNDDDDNQPTLLVPVVTASTTKVVITDLVGVKSGSACSDKGQIYTVDLAGKSIAYTICPTATAQTGTIALTAGDDQQIASAFAELSVDETDEMTSGPAGPTLSFDVTTNGQTITYLDDDYENVTGTINTLSGGISALTAVQNVVALHVTFASDGGIDAATAIDAGTEAAVDAAADATTD